MQKVGDLKSDLKFKLKNLKENLLKVWLTQHDISLYVKHAFTFSNRFKFLKWASPTTMFLWFPIRT